jgi:hypothetical protein
MKRNRKNIKYCEWDKNKQQKSSENERENREKMGP